MKPKELSHKNTVKYVASILNLEDSNLEYLYPNPKNIDLFSFDPSSNTKSKQSIVLTDAKSYNLDTIVIVAENFEMKNRTDATQSKLNDTLAKFQKLALIPAKQKILVLTDRGFYYAFREHLKYLTNNPSISDESFSKLKPESFTIPKDEVQVRLIEYPVFTNDLIVNNVKNKELTFSQILGALQYGFLKLENIPQQGFLKYPERDFSSNSSGNVVNVKQIIDYLFKKSGFNKDQKGRSSKGTSGKGNSPSSRPRKEKSKEVLKQ